VGAIKSSSPVPEGRREATKRRKKAKKENLVFWGAKEDLRGRLDELSAGHPWGAKAKKEDFGSWSSAG